MGSRDFENKFKNRVHSRVGKEYRDLRQDLGLTQRQAADLLKVSVRHYQSLEAGTTSPNVVKHMANMATLINSHYVRRDTEETTSEGLLTRIMTRILSNGKTTQLSGDGE